MSKSTFKYLDKALGQIRDLGSGNVARTDY